MNKQHLVDPQPLRQEASELLDALEDVLGHRAQPLAMYQAAGGIVYWDPGNVEITLLRPPVGAEYHSSITAEDVDASDDLEELLSERFGEGDK